MSMTILVLSLLCCLLLAILLLRPSTAVSTPRLIPASPPPHPQPRRVSFSPLESDASPPQPRRSSLHRRVPSTPEPPRPPRFGTTASADHVDRIPSPTFSRRISAPLRLSFTGRRRSSTASCTSTLAHMDPVDTSSTHTTQPSQKRTGFAIPFGKHARSRTLSPPSMFKSPDTPNLSAPSSPPAPRRTLVHRFKSIFKSKSIPSEPSVFHSQPILATIHTRLRRKPVTRTQPYGPPWNAPMPVPDCTVPQHSLRKPAQTSSPPQAIRRRSLNQGSRPPEKTSISPGPLSPPPFVSELDEKFSLLQQQGIQESTASLHG